MARPALRGILDGSLIRTGVMMVRRVLLGVLVSAGAAAALVAPTGASTLQAALESARAALLLVRVAAVQSLVRPLVHAARPRPRMALSERGQIDRRDPPARARAGRQTRMDALTPEPGGVAHTPSADLPAVSRPAPARHSARVVPRLCRRTRAAYARAPPQPALTIAASDARPPHATRLGQSPPGPDGCLGVLSTRVTPRRQREGARTPPRTPRGSTVAHRAQRISHPSSW